MLFFSNVIWICFISTLSFIWHLINMFFLKCILARCLVNSLLKEGLLKEGRSLKRTCFHLNHKYVTRCAMCDCERMFMFPDHSIARIYLGIWSLDMTNWFQMHTYVYLLTISTNEHSATCVYVPMNTVPYDYVCIFLWRFSHPHVCDSVNAPYIPFYLMHLVFICAHGCNYTFVHTWWGNGSNLYTVSITIWTVHCATFTLWATSSNSFEKVMPVPASDQLTIPPPLCICIWPVRPLPSAVCSSASVGGRRGTDGASVDLPRLPQHTPSPERELHAAKIPSGLQQIGEWSRRRRLVINRASISRPNPVI